MFVKEEKEFLFRMLSDIKINPLATEAVPLVQMIQQVGRKIYAAQEPGTETVETIQAEEIGGETKRKRAKKADDSEFV